MIWYNILIIDISYFSKIKYSWCNWQLRSIVSVPVVWEASEKIPELYEQWIQTRNVGHIQKVMLAKDKFQEICGSEETMVAALGSFDVLFGELSSVSLLQASAVSKLRNVQSNLKQVVTYGVAVHGVNVILNRMVNKVSRERAALMREQLVGMHWLGFSFVFCARLRFLHTPLRN